MKIVKLIKNLFYIMGVHTDYLPYNRVKWTRDLRTKFRTRDTSTRNSPWYLWDVEHNCYDDLYDGIDFDWTE